MSSYAAIVCPLLLHTSLNNCLSRTGQYYTIRYYTEPIMKVNINAHNVLFANSFPYFVRKSKALTYRNNYIALIYSYLFYSQYQSLNDMVN
jgi:hypothetical protein